MTRLSALLALALMVSAALPPKVAEAAPSCASLHNTPCSPRNSTTPCDWDGVESECICGWDYRWICPI